MMGIKKCIHKKLVKKFPFPEKRVCPKCVELGDEWVNLRQCMICGSIGCCDNSKNKHATAHFKETGHPIIRNLSLEDDGGEWSYCYLDDLYLN